MGNLRFVIIAAAAFAAVSCGREGGDALPQDAYGTLDLASIAVSTDETDVPTRAIATEDFILRVYDSGGQLVEEWDPFSLRPDDYKLEAGTYTLEICSPEPVDAAGWETPWYAASEEFEISGGEVTYVGPVTCTLGNIKVTVCYSEGMQEYLTDADVTITVGGGQLVFGRNESRAGYFRTTGSESEMEITLTATIDGEDYTLNKTLVGIKAGEWHMVRFAYNEAAGARTYYIYLGESIIGQIAPGGNWGVF